MNKKTVISCAVAALFVSGTALAADSNKPFEADGKLVYEQTTGNLVFDAANAKDVQTTGGFWIGSGHNTDKAELVFGDAAYTVEAKGDKVTNLDSLIGGNYLRGATKVKSATVGNTSLTVKGTKSEYVVGGSKSASAGDATLVNGNVTLNVINATTTYKPNKGSDNGNVIGGNYVKNHNQAAKVTAKVGDVNLTVGGTSEINGKVFGGSYAERYGSTTDQAVTLDVTSGNLTTTLTGGTFNAHVIAGNGASGKGTSAASGATTVTVNPGPDASVTFTNITTPNNPEECKYAILVGGSYADKEGRVTNGNTSVHVTGEGTVTLGKGIVGGNFVENNYSGDPAAKGYEASVINGSTHILIDGAKVTANDEIIGGTYMRSVSRSETGDKKAITSTVKGDTNIGIKSGTFNANVIGGGKSNGLGGNIVSNVEGDTFITISGTTESTKVLGAIIGGGSAKSGQHTNGTSSAIANVKGTTNVTITGGSVAGVIGGGLSYAYNDNSDKATIDATVGNTVITITGGTVTNQLSHDSGLDKFGLHAAIVGSGMAIDKSAPGTVSANTTGSSKIVITGKDTKVLDDIFGGGYATGAKASAHVKETSIVLTDVSLGTDAAKVNVYAGGYADNGAKTSTEKASITLNNTTVVGGIFAGGKTVATPPANGNTRAASSATSIVGEATITLIDSTVKGAVDVTGVTEDKSALVFTGANTVETVTGAAKDITFNATNAKAPVLTLGETGSIDMSKDKEIVVTNAQAGTQLVDGKVSVAKDTTVKVTSDFGETVFTVTEDLNDAANLTLTGAGLALGQSTIKPAELKVSANSKTLSEAYLGSLAFVNQGAEFIADEGLRAIRAAAKADAFTAFGAMTGGQSKYETGSNVKVKGVTLAAGTAGQFGNTTVAGFVEAGWASSDSNVSGTKADADHDYYGVGALVRYDFDTPFYLDGSLRIGQISTEFDGSFGAGKAKYDADSLYTTAHVGGGYVFDLAPGVKLDAYGRYVLSYLKGDDVTLDSVAREGFDMDDTTTHAVRIGARVTGAYQAINWYTGLAYEHVFDGKAEGKLNTYGISAALDAPELKGDSAILDLGFTMKPSETSPFTMGLGLKGYAGDRKGVSGNMSVLYTF